MYYYIEGTLILSDGERAVIDCHGVGYECFISLHCAGRLGKIGDRAKLYTYLKIKEDAHELYGFADPDEKNCFLMLTGISGVGPKAAMSILSVLTPQSLALAVMAGDHAAITAASGVGPKLAQRVVLELRDKVAKADFSAGAEFVPASISGGAAHEAIGALTILGYSRSEAAAAVGKCSPDGTLEDIIKQALKHLSPVK